MCEKTGDACGDVELDWCEYCPKLKVAIDLEQKQCGSCGQMRPFPRKEGKWQYKRYPAVGVSEWVTVDIVIDSQYDLDEYDDVPLLCVKDDEPIHWPNDSQWRKVEDDINAPQQLSLF